MIVQASVRILFIDDDEDDYIIFKDLISAIQTGDYWIEWCDHHTKVVDLICKNQYDICFIDYFLGSKNGLEIMQSCRACKPDLPFIFLTGKGSQSVSIDALYAGASDYLVKSELTIEKLERCIRYCIEKAEVLKKYRISEFRFRTIFEQSVDAIFISDEHLTFIKFNPAFLELLGYSDEDLKRMNLYQLIIDEFDSNNLRYIIKNTDVSKELELTIKNSSDKLIHVIFSYRKIYEIGNKYYIQGFLHDITQLKKMEQSLIISEKTAAAGRLSLALAHEIRNPLTNIQLSNHYLKNHLENEEQQDMVDIIDRNSLKIEQTLKQLLHSAERPHANFIKCNLLDVIENSISASLDHLTLKRIQLNKHYSLKTAFISADIDLLKMAISNIVINAIEAMDKPSPSMIIDVKQKDNFFILEIKDNGCGMTNEQIKKIFEPYYTGKSKGLGLGLSTALNILNVHKASIEVESNKDIGTTFTILFPKLEFD